MPWVDVTPAPPHKCDDLPRADTSGTPVGTVLECESCKKRMKLVQHSDQREGTWRQWERA